MRSLSSLFGRSPLGPLQEHMERATECAESVPELFELLIAEDRAGLARQREKIAGLEDQCDSIKNDLRSHLPRRLFMPVDRRDLLEILDLQDSIADTAQDIADILVERAWSVPDDMKQPLRDFVVGAVATCTACRDMMRNVDELVAAGFSGPDVEVVQGHIDAILRLEDAADELESTVSRKLFAHEDDMSAVSVILWLRIFEWVGDLADYPKKVGNRLRLLVAS